MEIGIYFTATYDWIVKNYSRLYLLMLSIPFFLAGCSSGSYDMDEIRLEYEEKIPIADSTRIVTEERREIKEEVIEKTENPEALVFIIQIGAFANESNFRSFFERARANIGESVYYRYINNLYKIRIGEYTNKAEAQKTLDFVKSLGYHDAFLLTVKR
jgi:hypothetical protein